MTCEEARNGAVQEWSKLMVEPVHKWSSPLISHYKDEYGRPRGAMKLEVACNAPPESNLRVTAQAYVGSVESGYSNAPTRLCKFVIALSVKMEGHGR